MQNHAIPYLKNEKEFSCEAPSLAAELLSKMTVVSPFASCTIPAESCASHTAGGNDTVFMLHLFFG